LAILIVVSSSYAELTQNDLDKIANLIDQKLEPIKQDIVNMKLDIAEMKGKIFPKEWFFIIWISLFFSVLAVPYLYGRRYKQTEFLKG